MKKVVLLFILSLAGMGVFAQKDNKAKDILDKTSLALNESESLSIQFTMNVKEQEGDVSQSFEGEMKIKQNQFHILTPDMETWFNGTTQWVLQTDWDEVTVSTPGKEEIVALNPRTIFELYQKGSSYKYIGEKTDIKGRQVYEIELIPQDKSNEIARVVLQISAKSYLPFKLHLVLKNKIENTIHISKYIFNEELPDAFFVFNKENYPNAEIIDLR